MASFSPTGYLTRSSSHGTLESLLVPDLGATAITGAASVTEAAVNDALALPFQAPVGPVLLAVDGSEECQPAIRLAREFAERRGASVHVITVGDARPGPIPPRLTLSVAPADRVHAQGVHREQLNDIGAFVSETLGQDVAWPITVVTGSRSHEIVAEAERIGASLIMLGLRSHHALERALHDETTLNVMRAAPCPVFGVTGRLFGLPRRILLGIDFSQASLTAARAALAMLADDGALMLAYVASPSIADLPDDGERVIHDLGVAAAFNWFDGELGHLGGATVEHVVLPYAPGRSVFDLLADYAVGASVDAIALGSARHGRVERWLLGSVSTDAARDGRYSLLVVPPTAPRAT